VGSERRSFLGVGRKKKEQESARWECGKRGSVFQGRWAAVGNRRAAPIAPARAVFHGGPRPGISTALRAGVPAQALLRRCGAAADAWRVAFPRRLRCRTGVVRTVGVRPASRRAGADSGSAVSPGTTRTAWPTADRYTAALAVGHDDHHRHRAGAMEVDVGIQMIAVKRIDRRGVFAPMWTKPRCLRSTAPFLASTRPLSPEWWARDLVCSIQSLLRSLATV